MFFEPVSDEAATLRKGGAFGNVIPAFEQHFPDWKTAEVVLVGTGGSQQASVLADAVRCQLYPFTALGKMGQVVDLGNFRSKETPDQYYDALGYVIGKLLEENKKVVILSDQPEAAFGAYLGRLEIPEEVTYAHIGPRFALGEPELEPEAVTFNKRVLTYEPERLARFFTLGYQRYFVESQVLETLSELNLQAVRYGELYQQLPEAEPYLRQADMGCFELSAIRQGDMAGSLFPSPGGFDAIEACQLARYAGLAPKLDCFVMAGYDPSADPINAGARQVAVMTWYLIEGMLLRKPIPPVASMRKYSVKVHSTVDEVVFYEDTATQRWWMEVPFSQDLGRQRPRTHLVACSEQDYHTTRKDELPQRWWQAFES